ncbi:hypothetical protein PV327_006968 [Microctonus hyperodae]|uniref:Uncharacterized protein n=1 Tax=Microctonus hyperodae TaxID=165561 RepID=A0AA39KIX6_MICHY|nr:hypothetical protein PV327_006968 [Microctonus hyperodae]
MLMTGLTIIVKSSAISGVWTLARDLIQYNVVGTPGAHQNTEWDFDPEQGKLRRVRFAALNGQFGEDLISRLGMGMDFNGPWGVKVSKPKPNKRYNLQS